jgi:hypothetical protein
MKDLIRNRKTKIFLGVLILIILIVSLISCSREADNKWKDSGENDAKETVASEINKDRESFLEYIDKAEGSGERIEDIKKEYKEKIGKADSLKEASALYQEFKEKLGEAGGKVEDPGDIKVNEDNKEDDRKNEIPATSNSSKVSTESNKAAGGSANVNNSSPNSSSKPNTKSSTTTGNTPSKPSTPEKQKVWIVDQAAWTETINYPATYKEVTKYRTETVTKYYCNGKYFDDYESGYEYYINSEKSIGSLSPVEVNVQVQYTETVVDKPAWTETINHPEKGHWEYR